MQAWAPIQEGVQITTLVSVVLSFHHSPPSLPRPHTLSHSLSRSLLLALHSWLLLLLRVLRVWCSAVLPLTLVFGACVGFWGRLYSLAGLWCYMCVMVQTIDEIHERYLLGSVDSSVDCVTVYSLHLDCWSPEVLFSRSAGGWLSA